MLGEAILLYRTASGEIIALRDRCCHRLAPLSKGRKEGDCVRCGYHGLLFDATGRCIEIPGSETVPAKVRVQRYPLAVKNKWVFVWMGDPAQADPALLPDNFSCDHPDWDYLPGYMHYATPQQLICDNLLDFSHLSYVHEKTLGGTTAIAQARAEIEAVPRGIRVTRRVHDVPPPPYYRAVRKLQGNLDRWFIYDFLLPGTLLMHSGGRPVADAEGDMSRAVRLHSCQTVTPETDDQHPLLLPAVAPGRGGRPLDRRGALQGAAGGVRGGPGDDHGAEPGDRRRPGGADAAAGDGRRGGALSQARRRDGRRRARRPGARRWPRLSPRATSATARSIA